MVMKIIHQTPLLDKNGTLKKKNKERNRDMYCQDNKKRLYKFVKDLLSCRTNYIYKWKKQQPSTLKIYYFCGVMY